MTTPLVTTEYVCAKQKCAAHITVRIPVVDVEHLCSGQNNTIRPMTLKEGTK